MITDSIWKRHGPPERRATVFRPRDSPHIAPAADLKASLPSYLSVKGYDREINKATTDLRARCPPSDENSSLFQRSNEDDSDTGKLIMTGTPIRAPPCWALNGTFNNGKVQDETLPGHATTRAKQYSKRKK